MVPSVENCVMSSSSCKSARAFIEVKIDTFELLVLCVDFELFLFQSFELSSLWRYLWEAIINDALWRFKTITCWSYSVPGLYNGVKSFLYSQLDHWPHAKSHQFAGSGRQVLTQLLSFFLWSEMSWAQALDKEALDVLAPSTWKINHIALDNLISGTGSRGTSVDFDYYLVTETKA